MAQWREKASGIRKTFSCYPSNAFIFPCSCLKMMAHIFFVVSLCFCFPFYLLLISFCRFSLVLFSIISVLKMVRWWHLNTAHCCIATFYRSSFLLCGFCCCCCFSCARSVPSVPYSEKALVRIAHARTAGRKWGKMSNYSFLWSLATIKISAISLI